MSLSMGEPKIEKVTVVKCEKHGDITKASMKMVNGDGVEQILCGLCLMEKYQEYMPKTSEEEI